MSVWYIFSRHWCIFVRAVHAWDVSLYTWRKCCIIVCEVHGWEVLKYREVLCLFELFLRYIFYRRWCIIVRLVMSQLHQLNPKVRRVDRLMGPDVHLRKHIQVCYLDSVECNLSVKSNVYSYQRDFHWRPHRLPLEIFLSTWDVFG